MEFEQYLLEQIERHPSVQPQDLVKLCYQAAYGAEHLLSDPARAQNYLEYECAQVEADNMALYEPISDQVCRVNLAAWKASGFPLQWLFRMFVASASVNHNGKEQFSEYLRTAERVVTEGETRFSLEDWSLFLAEYRQAGMPAVHHSSQYREAERPAYRIVNRQYIRLLPILESAHRKAGVDKVCVIAIDGRAASGKTTMAGQLQTILGADIIQMDHFFLPMELRTPERFAIPGSNVHHERFREEVLPHLASPEGFSYRIFDCSRMDFHGECNIGQTTFRIVEGSYSGHPVFGNYADITVFLDVEPDEQMSRIRRRNGDEMAEMFRERWIPLEENYFEQCRVSQRADIRL